MRNGVDPTAWLARCRSASRMLSSQTKNMCIETYLLSTSSSSELSSSSSARVCCSSFLRIRPKHGCLASTEKWPLTACITVQLCTRHTHTNALCILNIYQEKVLILWYGTSILKHTHTHTHTHTVESVSPPFSPSIGPRHPTSCLPLTHARTQRKHARTSNHCLSPP
jgi:hypothetical protein